MVNFFLDKKIEDYTIHQLTEFYHNKIKNSEQLYLDDIYKLAENEDWIESNHRFIQWLFPLNERSMFNPSAPVLTVEQIEALKKDTVFQKHLERSFLIMLRFYGFTVDEKNLERIFLSDVKKAQNNWLISYDHNQLRISRILNCLDLFDRDDLSGAFRNALKDAYEKYGIINTETIQYWKLTGAN